jgi:iron(III) transport system ATP-binding protein
MTDLPPDLTAQRGGPKGRAGPVFAGNLSVESVSYDIAGCRILDQVSLALEAGQVGCILGRSGCGKTTLLRMIAGVALPTSGRILLDGVEVSGPNKFVQPERRNVGLMFQDYALFPHMTVLKNVAYGLTALNRNEAAQVALLALDRVGLAAMADRYPTSLSGGEQQRVALARAIVPRPQVVLMDEPFSGLDQRLKETVRDDTLALLRETRATTLLVTHDPDEALAFADRIFVMGQGKVLQSGTPEELLEKPASVDVARMFRSFAAFEGIVENGTVTTPIGRVAAAGSSNGAKVTVTVPPQALRIVAPGQGVAAAIIENRLQGHVRRLLVRVEGLEVPLLVHSDVRGLGSCGLVLTGRDTHIFAH